MVFECSLSNAYISDFMVGQILFIISIKSYRSVPGEMNILSPKIETLIWAQKAKKAVFLKEALNDFDYFSIISGDHLPE